jgi:hypothetical protein
MLAAGLTPMLAGDAESWTPPGAAVGVGDGVCRCDAWWCDLWMCPTGAPLGDGEGVGEGDGPDGDDEKCDAWEECELCELE